MRKMKENACNNKNQKKNPGFLLSAVSSNSGKTAAACGLMSAFKQEGKRVCACKCGPDYIDPMFHREVLGVDSKNLDLFFSEEDILKEGYLKNTKDADITITEGVMGFYDGMSLDSVKGSSYDVAQTLGLPVILVINARGAAMTLVATVKGIVEFRPDSNIRGILLNRVSAMLYPRLKEMLENELARIGHDEIKIVGYMPENEVFIWKASSGTCNTAGNGKSAGESKAGGRDSGKNSDLELLEKIAGEAAVWKTEVIEESEKVGNLKSKNDPVRIAVARDEAFCFYYKDNLELLESLGCELIEFSPLHDKKLPKNVKGILLGGGYPELYGKELAENQSMLESIRRALNNKIPCLAECGGFMYLHKEMEDADGNVWKLVGRIHGKTFPTGKLVRFGYVNLQRNLDENQVSELKERMSIADSWILPGENIRAHEFHYWDSTDSGSDCFAVKPDGKENGNAYIWKRISWLDIRICITHLVKNLRSVL